MGCTIELLPPAIIVTSDDVDAVLSQLEESGADHPVAFYSRKLLPQKKNYSTIKIEWLAIKLGIQAFRVYLLGQPLTIQTDHRSLEWLNQTKENNPQLTRWSLFLQPYQYQIEYQSVPLFLLTHNTILLSTQQKQDMVWKFRGITSNEAEEAVASSLFCIRMPTHIGDVL